MKAYLLLSEHTISYRVTVWKMRHFGSCSLYVLSWAFDTGRVEPWTLRHFHQCQRSKSHSLGLTNILHHDLSYRLNFGLQAQTELWLNPADLSVPDYRSPRQAFPSSNCNERNQFVQMWRNSILKYIPLIS